MPNKLDNFVAKLRNDQDFRKRFAKDSVPTLREAGFDPDLLEMPANVSSEAILDKLSRVLDKHEEIAPPPPATASSMSADDLWNNLGVIGVKKEVLDDLPLDRDDLATDESGAAISAAVAIVIYGSSMATSTNSVATVTSGTGNLGPASLDQVKFLRDLQKSKADELRFSVTGADGVGVDGLSLTTLKAFLSRL